MTRSDFVGRLGENRLIPVIEIEQSEDAVPLANALLEGGLTIIEITFRTAAAAESIRQVRAHFPEMLVGAGTIVTWEQAEQAAEVGSQFLVSPGFEPSLAQKVAQRGLPYLPGIATASELQGALAAGFGACKFFPAEQSGGVQVLKTFAATFRAFAPRFVPTGGIQLSNLELWFREPSVLAVGGSWLALSQWVRDQDWEAIRESVATSVRIVRHLR